MSVWSRWSRRGARKGYSVQVVDVESLYGEYSYGVVDPQAIRAHIGWAAEHQGTEYVLLVGGDTYDYHDYLGLGSVSFVPTLYAQTDSIVKFAPVDPLYGDVDEDGIPDLSVGRLPVRTVEELASVIEKTLEYSGTAGTVTGATALVAADGYDIASGYSFTSASDEMVAYLPSEWTVERAYVDELGVAGAREALLAGMDEGPALTSYFGHSGLSVWSFESLFTTADAEELGNLGRPTVVTQWGCWNTYHVSPLSDTMGHKLLLSGDRGAAAAAGCGDLDRGALGAVAGSAGVSPSGRAGDLGGPSGARSQEGARREPAGPHRRDSGMDSAGGSNSGRPALA